MQNINNVSFTRAWLLSDIHLGVRAASNDWLDIAEDYFYNFFTPLLEAEQTEHEKDVLIVMGDVFDNRSSLNLRVLNAGIQIFEHLSSIMPVIVFPGNHDLYRMNSTEINSLKALKWIPNVYLIESPVIINCDRQTGLIVPWIGDPAVESLWLQNNPADYAFMHTDFTGMKYDRYRAIEHGIDTTPTNFKRIFSGHIHTRQDLNNITMVGSPYPLTRNDVGNDKGVYRVNFRTDTCDFFRNTYSPQFVRYHYNYVQELSMESLRSMFGTNFVDIVIPNNLTLDYSKFYTLFPDVRRFKFLNEQSYVAEGAIGLDEQAGTAATVTDIHAMCSTYVETLDEFTALAPERQQDVKLLLRTYYEQAVESTKITVE